MEGSLFSDAKYLILARADEVYLKDVSKLIGLDVLVFDAVRQVLMENNRIAISLNSMEHPPTCQCFLVAYGTEAHQQLEKFREWWARFNAAPSPEIINLNDGRDCSTDRHVIVLLREILRATEQDLLKAERLNWELQRQIIALRLEAEDSQSALDEMKRALRSQASEPKVVCEPAEAVSVPAPEVDAATEQFEFAFASWGMARIDLHFPNRVPARGKLAVRLTGLEDHRCLGAWEVSYEDLAVGWQPFVFPAVLTVRNYHLRLSVSWKTEEGSHPALSWSDQSIAPYGVSSLDAPDHLSKLPAIRLWTNIPGTFMPQVKYWTGSGQASKRS